MYACVYCYFPTAVRDWVDWEGHHGNLYGFMVWSNPRATDTYP